MAVGRGGDLGPVGRRTIDWVIMTTSAVHRATARVCNPRGLHMRPLELIARKAQSFQSQIHVTRGLNRVDAKSLLHLLTLGAEAGMELEVEANGADAGGAVEQIVKLIQSDFEMFEQPTRA